MEFQQTGHSIDILVQRIRSGRLALPNFQRKFVWDPGQVVELLDSISRQWPIGTLLLLSGPQPFAFRPVDSGPKISDDDLDLYILDGQQRVTALFHAIADVSEICYFVDFNVLLAGDDDPIRWERRSKFIRTNKSTEERAKNRIALVKEVWDFEQFYTWLNCQPEEAIRSEMLALRERRLKGLHSKVYKVLAIELEQSIELEALARIFETINRTGVSLNAFDLMVASLYPFGFNLRDEWERVKDQFPLIKKFAPNELELLKLVSLLIRVVEGKQRSKGVRQGDLLKLDRAHVQKYWNEAAGLYNSALHYSMEYFGVTCPELVPTWTMILGVAGWLRFNGTPQQIFDWWSFSIQTQSFSQAANTRIVAEFDWYFENEKEPIEILFEDPEPREWMTLPARSNGLLMAGFGAMMVKHGALDILTEECLSNVDNVAFRVVTEDGEIKRPDAEDPLSQILVVSKSTDKRLPKIASLGDIEASGLALRSQGFSMLSFQRDIGFVQDIFRLSNSIWAPPVGDE